MPDLTAARKALEQHPDPAPDSLAAHLRDALTQVDRLQEVVNSYGTPILGAAPLPPPDPARVRQEKDRGELEAGFTTQEWAVGLVLCPARGSCPNGLLGVFKPLKNGKLPMHRSDHGMQCPGAGQRPTTPTLRLKPRT
ncbi:hypothetical protein ACFUC2_04790 [[Kitasatospora] papulosa]|uniref:hypothetical protein n=1 Tax=[Kitasatospora] papulosa TaxID=1464011 RepID=UPI0036340157